jgi:hypothetical protein
MGGPTSLHRMAKQLVMRLAYMDKLRNNLSRLLKSGRHSDWMA